MLTLIIGGARSGKSRFAQALCRDARNVLFIATASAECADEEMCARISRHRAERPHDWLTIEEPLYLERVVREAPPDATLLIDCITLWVSNLMWEHKALADDERENIILSQVVEFTQAAQERQVIAVSNEVGSGIVPDNNVGRTFRDLQGLVNQLLARVAARVVLVVAGLPLVLKDDRG
jgi:adenosylcobinamide kinase/adenosylcobinamide-phosphate guanylyltransferase